MITKSHALLFYYALLSKWNITENSSFEVRDSFRKSMLKKIPWLFVPDALRPSTGGRQATHFEIVPYDASYNCSWIKYPSESELKQLNTKNADNSLNYEVKKGYYKSVIGERTVIGEFDVRNFSHKYYDVLRCHLVQDICFDEMVRRSLVDCSKRFFNEFTIYHSEKVISGEELRSQLSILQELGFIRLAGIVYEKTGIETNRNWFEKYILSALKEAYPEDMAIQTYKFMELTDEVDQRITSHNFELTPEEINSVILTDNLERFLDEMFAKAIRLTKFEL